MYRISDNRCAHHNMTDMRWMVHHAERSISIWYASSKQLPWPKLMRPNIPGWAATARSASVMSGNTLSMTFAGSPGSDMQYFVCWYCEKSPEHLWRVDNAHAIAQLVA